MLDREATEALRAVAAARTPDEGAAARAWVAMQQRLVDGPPALDIDPTRDAARGRTRRLAVAFAVAAVVLLAVGLASWSAGWLAGLGSRSDEQAPYTSEPSLPLAPASAPVVVHAVAPTPATSPSLALPQPPAVVVDPPGDAVVGEPAAAPPTPLPAGPSRRAEPRRRVEPRPAPEPAEPEPATSGTTLEAELRLLGQANAAMRAGRHVDALAVLARHAREFPTGQLAPEREYKRALVLCELDRGQEARAVAQAFARAHPQSPLRAKAEEVCREGAQ